jgi:predicted HAD superfamily Cof-like phosphohydrolase
MLKTSLQQVKEFHKSFGHPVNAKPELTNKQLSALRVELIQEELNELKEALAAEDPVETLDALTDLQYVLDGAFLSLGFWKLKDLAVTEVHNSNMSKLGEDGKPIYREDGKILKGPNFKEPDMEGILNALNSCACGGCSCC